MGSMRTRRWLFFSAFVLVVALAVGLWARPEVIRRVAIARIHAMTGRPVHIERVAGNVLTGRFAVHGFRLAERDGQRAFADFDRLDVSLKLSALLRGHLWIRELVLDGSTIRVVRLPTNTFNFSDLVQSSGSRGRGSDVTVDHFVLKRGTVVLEDEALVRDGDTVALVPRMTTRVHDFAFKQGAAEIGSFAAEGAVKVRDPMAKQRGRFQHADVRANLANLTWPATTPGHVEVLTTIQGGGKLAVTGMVNAPPKASELRLQVNNFDLAPWAQFLPLNGRVSGVAEADLRVNEPLAVGIPARMQGSVAVTGVAVADLRHEVIGAQRIEASGLELHWPAHAVVKGLVVSGPRGGSERDRGG